MKSIAIDKIPKEGQDELANMIHQFSVGIIGVTSELDAFLLGSGSLVKIEKIYGILTAKHVTDCFYQYPEIGIIISTKEHRFKIDREMLSIIEIPPLGTNQNPSFPDISIVILPLNNAITIDTHKAFYNLSKRRDIMLGSPLPLTSGIWGLCGLPDELKNLKSPADKFPEAMGYNLICFYNYVHREYLNDVYDIICFDINYNQINKIPVSF